MSVRVISRACLLVYPHHTQTDKLVCPALCVVFALAASHCLVCLYVASLHFLSFFPSLSLFHFLLNTRCLVFSAFVAPKLNNQTKLTTLSAQAPITTAIEAAAMGLHKIASQKTV